MRALFISVSLLLLQACASVDTRVTVLDPSRVYAPSPKVEILLRAPDRPYLEIAKLESKGAIGEPEATLLEDAREKARALGADAIVTLETLTQYIPPYTVWDPWPPGYLGYRDRWYRDRFFGPGFWAYGPAFPFGPYRTIPGGNAYTVRAIAIKYL